MRVRIEAEAGEIRSKGRELVKRIADTVAREDPALARALDAVAGRQTLVWNELEVVIENDVGSVRHWRQPDGRRGTTRFEHAYGFIRGVLGADREGYDCFLGPDADATHVFVVHQNRPPDFDRYDEDKAMLGFSSVHAAQDAYLRHYDDPRFLGSIAMLTLDELKERLGLMDRSGMLKGSGGSGMRALAASSSDLRRSQEDALYAAAANSPMGNRAVNTGSAGLNIQVHSPVQLKPETDSRTSRGRLDLQSEEELAYARHSSDARKRGLMLIMGQKTEGALRVFEVQPPEYRAEATAEVIEAAPAERALLELRGARYRNAPESSQPGRDVPALMLPASARAEKAVAGAEAVAEAAAASTVASTAGDPPAPAEVAVETEPSPLGLHMPHTVTKRGLGRVTLTRSPSGFHVAFGDIAGDVEFSSLSAACDHVWARQQGYQDASEYKAQHGVNKVPSGAGWKFWGLARGSP